MIKIICVGKLKEKYWQDACFEYLKRIQKYHGLKLIEVKDSTVEKEKEEIEKYILPKEYVITLEIEGKQMSSIDFATTVEGFLMKNPNITFIIGGSDGLHKDIKQRSDYKLSFSYLTFPHQLFRVMLLEQIYRAFKIIHHETYHK